MRGVNGGGAPARRSGRVRRTLIGVTAAVLLPFGAAVPAGADADPNAIDFAVESSMGTINTRIVRAADGNTDRVVYLLDGERAENDLNGWEKHTSIPAQMAKFNINVVMPVGGQSSFYADWEQPSSFNGVNPDGSMLPSADSGSAIGGWEDTQGKTTTYQWETFITKTLPEALKSRLGFSATRNGVLGLSSGGSAALLMAAYHPEQFSYAGSLSGYLHMSMPGMREALGAAMIASGGYNIEAMAPAGSEKWRRMDPYGFAEKLIANNTRLYISAGSAKPADQDLSSVDAITQGMPLEAIALANTRSFEKRLTALGYTNVTYDFPDIGIHNWGTWEQVAIRLMPEMAPHIGKPLPAGAKPPAGAAPPGAPGAEPPAGGAPPK
ncbi:alpha/beta hydrolase [Nocardia caishijiensis]|uniref:Diacylglycerol O-acyltransferase/trehalose O-mycolyltransferase n=1 Tax=Nocardia caishijiensis TaxID=184756 RepID=A0ABQ6YL22_9NOCA|nr:alpha/beta hydrolase family protein [Nocardia caishijiensis]KAF0846495.1 diacylglycerol O-acyltransferase/trehalose O-mycolyltransferase [Nocardia caishijiensis]